VVRRSLSAGGRRCPAGKWNVPDANGTADDLTVVSEVKPNALATEADRQVAAEGVAHRIKDLLE